MGAGEAIRKADPYAPSRARHTAAGKKKRGTAFGMTVRCLAEQHGDGATETVASGAEAPPFPMARSR